MTETQEEPPQQLSIQARIAALKLDQVGRAPSAKQPPALPSKPPINRAASAAVLPTIGHEIGNEPNGEVLPPLPQRNGKPPLPSLPPRRESANPPLPSRRPTELNRKSSQESISSTVSSVSAISNGTARTSQSRQSMDHGRIRAPVYDPQSLPPLPPSRRVQEKDTNGHANMPKLPSRPGASKSTTNVSTVEIPTSISPKLPSLPQRSSNPTSPPLPSRSNTSTSPALPDRPNVPTLPQRSQPNELPLPPRKLPPTTIPPVSSRSPNLPQRPTSQSNGAGIPPPIPAATRPDLNKLLATKPKSSAVSSAAPQAVPTLPGKATGNAGSGECLHCRDFSGPDEHAAKFPRQDVPYMSWLAEQLTAPFPSQTDKARAIFAWCHYNIDYDVDAFFNKNIQPSTPAGTIESGLAVCEGYAGLFAGLATSAGMEAIVVGGHGKGFGYQPLKAGEPCPPKDYNHAWNAVKIDGGEWKLLDACWGAGSVCGQKYTRHFKPLEFVKSNEDFGLKHFPNDPKHWYRADGRSLTWEEYYIGDTVGEPVLIFGDFDEGFSHTSVSPKQAHISCNPSAHMGPTIRFQFQRICAHWDPIRNGKGKPYVYVLSVGKGNRELIAFDNDGRYWWVDVPLAKLGSPGDEILLLAISTVGGHDARGMSKSDWLAAYGRKAWGSKGCARWIVSA